MKKRIKDIVKVIIFLGIGVFLIWFFLNKLTDQDKSRIVGSFGSANYFIIVLSVAVALLSHIIRTLRWQMLLRAAGQKAGFTNTFLALMIGYFANLALPRLGEVTRCGLLNKYEKVPFNISFGTVISERALDLITFLILFFVNLLIQYNTLKTYVAENFYQPLAEKFVWIGKGYVLWAVIILFIVCLILTIVYHSKLIRFKPYAVIIGIVKGFWTGLKSIAKIRNPILFIVYTLGIWVCYFFMTWIVFFSLTEMAGLGPVPAFSALVIGTIGIMLLPGGVGIYPILIKETLGLYGAESAGSYALGWLLWGTQTISIIAAGIIALIVLPIINSSKNGATAQNQEQSIPQ